MAQNEMVDEIVAKVAYEQMAQLKTAVKETSAEIVSLSKAAREAFTSLGDVKGFADFVANNKKAEQSSSGLSAGVKKLTDDQIKLRLETMKYNAEAKLRIQIEQAQEGSIAKLMLIVRQKTQALRELELSEKNAAEAAKLRYEIDTKNAFIKKNVDSLSAQRINIGNYAGALADMQALKAEMEALSAAGLKNSAEYGALSEKAKQYQVALGGVAGEMRYVNSTLTSLAAAGQQGSEQFEQLTVRAAELKAIMSGVAISIKEASAEMVASSEKGVLAFEKLGETIKEIGKFALTFFGVQLGMEFIGGISEEFGHADDEARKLSNTLQNAGAANSLAKINNEVKEITERFQYLDDYQVQGVFDKLITYGKLTEAQMKSLIPVIIDYSAKEKVSIEDGATTILKALEGNAKALKAYGINIKDAATETEKAASPADRLSLIMKELKPRVEGSAAAFAGSFSGGIGEAKRDLREIELAIADFVIALSGVEDRSHKNAVAAKTEAMEGQKLIDEYDTLSKKVDQTAGEKKRLSDITVELGTVFGNSVLSINEETGAMELNIEATKTLIKQKMLLADQDASRLARDYNAAKEDEERAKRQIELDKQRYAAVNANNKLDLNNPQVALSRLPGGLAGIDILTDFQKQTHLLEVATKDRLKALQGLKDLHYSEEDIDKLFSPSAITPRGDLAAGGKVKDGTDTRLKNEQELTKELYDEYAKRLEIDAQVQKAISEDEKKSLEERLIAYRRYADLTFQAQAEGLSAQSDNIDAALKEIEKLEAKSAAKRTQQEKELIARKAVLLQQRNNISAQYDLLEQQHIDKTAKEIISIQENEVSKRVASVKSLTSNVDIQEAEALQILNQSLKSGTVSYEKYTKQRKEIEDKFQKEKYSQLRDYLQSEINDLGKQGVDTRQLQEQLNAALKNLYDADFNAFVDGEKKKSEVKKELTAKEWEAVDTGLSSVKTLTDSYYQKQLDHEQALLDAIEIRKNAQIDAVNSEFLSEEDKKKKIASINQTALQQEKQIQNEQRKLKREQAIADRVAALLGVVEGVAKAEAANLVNFATPVTAAYGAEIAALIAGIGAAQVATILAQPLPAYRYGIGYGGKGDHPGGRAVLGDGWERERVFEPGKAPYWSEATPTVYDLPAHTSVIPEHEHIANMMAMMAMMAPASIQPGVNVNNDFSRVEQSIKQQTSELKQAIVNKAETTYVARNGEWRKIVKKGTGTYEFMNKNIR